MYTVILFLFVCMDIHFHGFPQKYIFKLTVILWTPKYYTCPLLECIFVYM